MITRFEQERRQRQVRRRLRELLAMRRGGYPNSEQLAPAPHEPVTAEDAPSA